MTSIKVRSAEKNVHVDCFYNTQAVLAAVSAALVFKSTLVPLAWIDDGINEINGVKGQAESNSTSPRSSASRRVWEFGQRPWNW